MKFDEILGYAQHVNINESGLQWVNQTLKNYLDKNQHVDQVEVEHILDYISQVHIPKILMMSYPQAVVKAKKWSDLLQKKAEKIEETKDDTKVIHDFKDGFKIVQLVGKRSYEREGKFMRNCVGSYYGRDVKVYSLRDKQNNPHCTMEQDRQIKGKGNGPIHPKYISYVVKFLELSGMQVTDREMLNLGYINVEKYKKHLSAKLTLFQGKYHYKSEQLVGKDGNEFACLDLLDQIPLIDYVTMKINFKLETFIKLSFDFLYKAIRKKAASGNSSQLAASGNSSQLAASGDSSQLAASGDSSQLAASGNSSQLAASGNSSQLAASGDSSQLAASGNFSQLAASGNFSQLAASGNSSQLAASGNFSQLASSGNTSKLASSGDFSKLASSGNTSQLASSGDSSQLASSGDFSKLASSGDFSRLEIKGAKSVGANIGIEGKIKGVKGSWITLAEFNQENEVVFVKSVKIDGKKIKENVWYILKNKKFIEVKEQL